MFVFKKLVDIRKGEGAQLMPPPHLNLPNNRSLSQKPGKALSFIVEVSNYPNAPTRTCSGDCWVGLRFHTWSLFYLPSNECWIVFVPCPNALLFIYLTITTSCVLTDNTKSNKSQGREVTILRILHSCFMSRYRWEGRYLRLKTSTFSPCHIIEPFLWL